MKTSSQARTKEILKIWAVKANGPSGDESVLKMTLLYVLLYFNKLLLPNEVSWVPNAAKCLAASMLLFPSLSLNRFMWEAELHPDQVGREQ